jgi:hypothetical protein
VQQHREGVVPMLVITSSPTANGATAVQCQSCKHTTSQCIQAQDQVMKLGSPHTLRWLLLKGCCAVDPAGLSASLLHQQVCHPHRQH